MEQKDLFSIINKLISQNFVIEEFQEKLIYIVERHTYEHRERGRTDRYYYKYVLDYLLTNDYIQESSLGVKIMFSIKWEALKEFGTIEQYLQDKKQQELEERRHKERSKQISEESLIASKEANRISGNAKWISFGSLIVSVLALIYSFNANESKELKELKNRIVFIEGENDLIREQYLKQYKAQERQIDSLNIEVNKLKK